MEGWKTVTFNPRRQWNTLKDSDTTNGVSFEQFAFDYACIWVWFLRRDLVRDEYQLSEQFVHALKKRTLSVVELFVQSCPNEEIGLYLLDQDSGVAECMWKHFCQGGVWADFKRAIPEITENNLYTTPSWENYDLLEKVFDERLEQFQAKSIGKAVQIPQHPLSNAEWLKDVSEKIDDVDYHVGAEEYLADEWERVTHPGMFLAWAIDTGLGDQEWLLEEFETDTTDLLQRRCKPNDPIRNLDGTLTDEVLNQLGNNFAADCYEEYLKQYLEVCGWGYDGNDSWERYEQVKPILDALFEGWLQNKQPH